MQDAETFWDKAAEKYAKDPIADIEAYNFTLERTRSYLSAADHVLEVGCGTGSTALLLAGSAARITASDVSGNMITIARDKAKRQGVSNVEFITADIFNQSDEDGPYNAVLALNLLHLLEDVPAAVKRIHGLLGPGGKFISKTPCLSGKGGSIKLRLIKTILPVMQFFGKAPYVCFLSSSELEAIVTAQGFTIIETSNSPPPSRYIVAVKN